MEKKELLESSPVRNFEKISSPLNDGEFGLITAKKGLGKTSILVQLGIDSLLNDKEIAHISFDQQSSNVISWYSSIITEIIKKKNVPNPTELKEEIFKKRTILNFNQEAFTLPKVANTIKVLNENGLKIKTMVIDGLDLAKTSCEDLHKIADFAKAEKICAWFSYTCEADSAEKTLDAEKMAMFEKAAHLEQNGEELTVTSMKGGQGCIKIDTKTLLMC